MTDKPNTETSQRARSWRDVIEIHPAAEMFPLVSTDELKSMAADIKKHGLKASVVMAASEPGKLQSLLDGRNRLDAMELAGLPVLNKEGNWLHPDIRYSSEHGDPYAFVLSINLQRRHLTSDDKRDLAAKMLKAQPQKSNRTIGKQIGADDKTIGSVRRELEGRAEIPHVSTVEDSRGRKQPTKKPSAKKKRRTVDDYLAEKKARLPIVDATVIDIMPIINAKMIDISPIIDTTVTGTPPIIDTTIEKSVQARTWDLDASVDDYCVHVMAWCPSPSDIQDRQPLINAIKRIGSRLQELAQAMEDRDHDTSDGLDIPNFLKRVRPEASTSTDMLMTNDTEETVP